MKGRGLPLGLAAALLMAGAAPAFAAECPARGEATAIVAEVIDGATLRLGDGVVLRLAGIEAPARPLTLAAEAPWPGAEASRAGLAGLVAGATVAFAPAGDSPDRYGRRHGYAFLADGRSLQAAMLAAGFARARWFPGESECFPAFLAAEKGARLARRGLWAGPEYAARNANDPSLLERNGLYDLVEGRVVSVGHGSRMIFLDFGHDFRRDFTIMVSPPVAEALAAAGLPADGFADRRVRVRGVIEEASGPAIRLNDPAEIEILDE